MNHTQLIEDNILTYYKAIARLLNGDFIETDEVAWFTTGRRSLYRFNGVVSTKIRAGDLSKVIDPILETFLSKDLPFFWVVWSDSGTPGLGDYLNSKNVRFEHFTGMPCMSRGLDNLPELPLLQEVEIVRVQSQQEQANWLNVLMEGFDEPAASRTDFQQILANSLAEPDPMFEHFLARWQGAPCSISTLLKAEHGAGIYHVTTLPQHRGKKLGKALTLAAMQSARRAGYKEAVLFATPSGFPIYQQLDFQTVSTVDAFIWSGHE
ncbi:MAG: GNAT family N-acetyltransferase [Chloroflexi bacterium]|nr:MAG: GNAT family N-acetyltransferase [Chloroflexota bacterium]